VHTLSLEATEMFEKARDKVAQFINAKNSAEIVFVRSTTEAINLLAYSWGLSNLSKGDEVLVSLMEHHSNIVPWELTSKIKGFTIRYAEINSDGTLDYNDLERKISEKTKIVCLSHVSNVTGVINDIKQVTKTAHENNALILVDGAQSVPHLKVDVQDLGVDFLAFSGHKMLGPTGVGILYGKKELLEGMVPFQGGGEMIKEVEFPPGKDRCALSWNEVPWKFEAGTPNISGAIGLMEAIKYLERLGMDNVLSHEKALTKYAVERLSECQKITLHGSSDLSMKCGIIPFSMEGLSSHDIALLCDNYGIMIRSGFHCAQPLHQVFKLKSSARASFYVYNTNAEIDKFVEVLKEVQQL
jgi:cysteine desulfurase / selenocysteine lyase